MKGKEIIRAEQGARLLAQATSFWKCARKHKKETHRGMEGKETPQDF